MSVASSPAGSQDVGIVRQRKSKNGWQRGWYSSGRPWYDENYKNGVRHGRCRGWYSNGQPEYDHNYSHGKQHGLQCAWLADGTQTRDDWFENDRWWNWRSAQNMVRAQKDIMIEALLEIVASYVGART